MKISIFVLAFLPIIAVGQPNLIPNSSFEATFGSSNDWTKERKEFNDHISDWQSPTDATPDIFKNDVAYSFNYLIQGLGHDLSHSGETMVGITTFVHPSSIKLHKREYLHVQLNQSIFKNKKYKISAWIKSPKRTLRASHLSFLFTNQSFYKKTVNRLAAEPEWTIDTILGANNWTKIEYTFIAQNDAQYLTIGNFENNDNVQYNYIAKKPVLFAYYYFDDIEIIEIEEPTIPVLVKGKTFTLNNIHFEFDKAILLSSSFAELEKLTIQMNNQPDFNIEIRGHTDNQGNDIYNQKLSEARAQAVVNYLVGNGISKERLSFKGYGESLPVTENETENGRQLNRRVELLVF